MRIVLGDCFIFLKTVSKKEILLLDDHLGFSKYVAHASCNHGHNILRRFDVLPNFPFTSSETKRDYLEQTWYIRAVSRVAE